MRHSCFWCALALLGMATRPLLAECHEPGAERWPIKSSILPGADVSTPRRVPLSGLLALANVAGVTKDDQRYQDARIQVPADASGLHEGEIISTTGYLRLVATEDNDCEYHIQITDTLADSGACMIVEVAKDDVTSIVDPELQARAGAIREWIRTKLLRGNEPSAGGNLMIHPVYVAVTGQLFYDDSHVGDRPRGKRGMKAASLWEIHPIVALGFAPVPG